ncbi:tRNA (adenosine(37)-N6)-threonylcarbamoyltransferase complex dimerization subunit type 1 TsaB [Candidatus Bipolaricaulota bacterium]|nr:tRNA (adenosine(37)-N6)-threonylcarbamoyltransferase complex dimerization subunit type 1 TsaB [Candidatus Bipolaricaulota bacterium]
MLTLGFDTATEVGTVGLIDGDEVIGEFTFGADESQSERLLPSIELLMEESDLSISDVEKIGVSRGPGSFTGLRIGISSAKGLAHGLGVPLVGIPLTTCYYSKVEYYPGPVYTLIKDRRDLVYYAGFNEAGEKIGEEESVPLDEIEDKISLQTDNTSDPVLLVGDAVPGHRNKLSKIDKAILSEGELNYPSGLQVAFLGKNIREGENELASLEPLYAQRPIAEINWSQS